MIKETITIDDAINLLNQIVKMDPVAAKLLLDARVLCNKQLADHETIQVRCENGTCRVGILGILNGIFGIQDDGWGPIAAVVEDDGNVVHFQRTTDVRKDSD
jgi:hypothetical protein